jgi:LysM repeat protein
MSTLTLSAPIAAPRRTRPRTTVTSLPCGRPGTRRARAVASPQGHAVARGAARRTGVQGALRLTRRGRLVILALLLAVGAVLSLAVSSSGLASSAVEQVPVQYVTVAPGDTLWSIAGDVAPGTDRRDTVAEIVELNALDGSSVRAGQRIAVPVGQ